MINYGKKRSIAQKGGNINSDGSDFSMNDIKKIESELEIDDSQHVFVEKKSDNNQTNNADKNNKVDKVGNIEKTDKNNKIEKMNKLDNKSDSFIRMDELTKSQLDTITKLNNVINGESNSKNIGATGLTGATGSVELTESDIVMKKKRCPDEDVKNDTKNDIQLAGNGKTIYVEINNRERRFTFYNDSDMRNIIGSFSVDELVKYVMDPSNVTIDGIDINTSRPIITKYVCVWDNNTGTYRNCSIKIIDYNESPFMGNIEMMMKLHAMLIPYEKAITEKCQKKMIDKASCDKFDDFMFSFMNHILRIISIITNKIGKSDENISKLLSYSTNIVYKMTKKVKKDNEIYLNVMENLKNDMTKVSMLRNQMTQEINELKNKYNIQENTSKMLINGIINHQMHNSYVNNMDRSSEIPTAIDNMGNNNDEYHSDDSGIFDIEDNTTNIMRSEITNLEDMVKFNEKNMDI